MTLLITTEIHERVATSVPGSRQSDHVIRRYGAVAPGNVGKVKLRRLRPKRVRIRFRIKKERNTTIRPITAAII